MKRFVDYRTVDKENNEYAGLKIWTRNHLELETPDFRSLTDVIHALRRWYGELDLIKIENLDFKKIEDAQIQAVYDEEERRWRHDPMDDDLPY